MPGSYANKFSIGKTVKICLEKNLVFAAYRLPNRQHPEIVIQISGEKRLISPSDPYSNLRGFLVAPFSEVQNSPAFIINPDIYAAEYLVQEDYERVAKLKPLPILSDNTHIPEQIAHDKYLGQIKNITNQIKKGTFEKVVLSRVKIVQGNYVFKLNQIFTELVKTYPNAFVYIFNAGPHLWMGATPEPLLKGQKGTMSTVSLAGTRPYNKQNLNIGIWNSKERLEQEYVTRYISKVLSKFNLTDVSLEGPGTKRAGNLVHLCTNFSFRSDVLKDRLGEFLNNLHPTPAVCGMPREESLQLILNLEEHHREYYSGFLGPIGLNEQISLFVNLRCMKVLQNNLALFIGGGITADSVSEEEWQETEIKAETLLSVIRELQL